MQHSVYSGFFRRVAASVIDTALIALTVPLCMHYAKQVTMKVLFYLGTETTLGEGLSQELILGSLLALLVALSLIVLAWFLSSALLFAMAEALAGASPGKYVMGLRVVSLQGEYPSLIRALIRQTAKSASTALLGLGFLMIAWTERKQALHDKLARCVVIESYPLNWIRVTIAGIASILVGLIFIPDVLTTGALIYQRTQRAIQLYQSLGPVQQLGWEIAKEGFRQLSN